MIVGVTGGIGAGKSTACNLFKALGVPVISADYIAGQLLNTDQAILAAIVKKFGPQILQDQHIIDRVKLQNIIFNSAIDRKWLEALLHPLIKQQIAEQTKILNYPYCIVEIPLLIEAEMESSVDRILTIDCPEAVQLERAIRRDNSSPQNIQAIIAIQSTRQERMAKSHDIIDNSADLAALKNLVMRQHKYYLSLATHENH